MIDHDGHEEVALNNAERVAASMRGGAHARLDVSAVAAVGASILPGAMAHEISQG